MIRHKLICGSSGSGKSEDELGEMVRLANNRDCAIVLLDPPGTLARKFLVQMDYLGHSERMIYDRLQDTDRTLGYDWLTKSEHPDPLQRLAVDDERIRAFTSVLIRRRGLQDTTKSPLTEEVLILALKLYLYQKQPVPLYWLPDVLVTGTDASRVMVANCTDASIASKFAEYGAMKSFERKSHLGPAERLLRPVCTSPAFMVRAGGTAFDLGAFLDNRGILALDGSSSGNLSRDATATIMGSIILRIIQHCRTRQGGPKVVLVLDEAVNASLIGLNESQALAEVRKWGLEFHILVQDPFSFPTPQIQDNVLQNCWVHKWFRQGSPKAAAAAAEDIATPALDPLKVHHTEYRVRTADDGYDLVTSKNESMYLDPTGKKGKGRSVTHSWRPRRKEVKDAQDKYMALSDQVLLTQKELMGLQAGWFFSKGATRPEYVPMLADPWVLPGMSDAMFEDALARIKRRAEYRVPVLSSPPSASAPPPSAKTASRLREKHGMN